MENNIREFYRGRQIEVSEIDLERVDDQRMRGGATLQDNMGNRARVDCTATRENVRDHQLPLGVQSRRRWCPGAGYRFRRSLAAGRRRQADQRQLILRGRRRE